MFQGGETPLQGIWVGSIPTASTILALWINAGSKSGWREKDYESLDPGAIPGVPAIIIMKNFRTEFRQPTLDVV